MKIRKKGLSDKIKEDTPEVKQLSLVNINYDSLGVFFISKTGFQNYNMCSHRKQKIPGKKSVHHSIRWLKVQVNSNNPSTNSPRDNPLAANEMA